MIRSGIKVVVNGAGDLVIVVNFVVDKVKVNGSGTVKVSESRDSFCIDESEISYGELVKKIFCFRFHTSIIGFWIPERMMKVEVTHDVEGVVIEALCHLFNDGNCCIFGTWVVDIEDKDCRSIEELKGVLMRLPLASTVLSGVGRKVSS